MKTGIIVSLIFSLISLAALNGCLGVDHNFVSVRNDLLSAVGTDYHRDMEFSLGSLEMGILRKVIKSNVSDRDAGEIIKHVSEVQIGVYKNHSIVPLNDKFQILKNIDRKMSELGWMFLVRNCRGNKLRLVYVKNRGIYGLTGIFIVSLNPGKLEMAEVRGRLEKILTYIIKEKGLSAQFAAAGY